MSQAEMLLNETAGIPIHEHPVIDNDSHYIIDPITRTISNASGKNVLIQYDHNSERFTFEIPRYIDGHDMSLCNATKVHYINIEVVEQDPNALAVVKPKTKPGIYEVDDVEVSPDDDDLVLCSWLISRNATQLSGTLSFLIQYACVDDNNNLTYEWHTDVHTDVLINKGMNNGPAIIASSVDIIEQWKTEIFEEILTQFEEELKNVADNFQDGKDGYTPVRGVDYWTDTDKNEIVSAVAPFPTTVILKASDWVNNQQTVTVEGVTSDKVRNVVLVSSDLTSENDKTYSNSGVKCVSKGEGWLTFECEDVPNVDLVVNLLIYDSGRLNYSGDWGGGGTGTPGVGITNITIIEEV